MGKKFKNLSAFSALAAALLGAVAALAGGLAEPIREPEQDPCLSFGNLPQTTLEFFGGTAGGIGFSGLSGSVYVPNGNGRDFQIDADLGHSGDGIFGQLAGHLALRQFASGRAALYGGWSGGEGGDGMWRLGAEVEKTFAAGRLAAVAGWQSEGDDHLFVDSRLTFDLTPATRLSLGYAYDDGSTAKLRAETALGASSATTVYLEGQVGEGGETALLAGLQIRLGRSGPACATGEGAGQGGYTHWTIPGLAGGNGGGGGGNMCVPMGGACSGGGQCCAPFICLGNNVCGEV